MSDDWAAVARVINERVNQLGWRQRELAERSQVSQAIVREIQHHTVERRRSARTLEALSTTLGLHPQHLQAVLEGSTPPEPGEAVPMPAEEDRLPAPP
ncbi:helix-turn-helix domain-containing protein, partial [Actinoalloteichus caeruleus]|uniref:helix-turn-helix domain-containing protein n=1 Tax=Actinoalloteichus cyanogriseus TaxID=2893586 RepID=UPI0009DDCBE1